eukprot:Skav223155  [mRNA]  locus=scaffold2973:66517:69782:- [translate_table: standard]
MAHAHYAAVGFSSVTILDATMEGDGRDPAVAAYAADATISKTRHFCRKAQCDGSCFSLGSLEPPWPKQEPPKPEDEAPNEPPLKRRKTPDVPTTSDNPVDGRDMSSSQRAGPTVMSSMGHLVLDVTRMAAFSTAGYVLSGPLGATVAFSVASAKSLRNP